MTENKKKYKDILSYTNVIQKMPKETELFFNKAIDIFYYISSTCSICNIDPYKHIRLIQHSFIISALLTVDSILDIFMEENIHLTFFVDFYKEYGFDRSKISTLSYKDHESIYSKYSYFSRVVQDIFVLHSTVNSSHLTPEEFILYYDIFSNIMIYLISNSNNYNDGKKRALLEEKLKESAIKKYNIIKEDNLTLIKEKMSSKHNDLLKSISDLEDNKMVEFLYKLLFLEEEMEDIDSAIEMFVPSEKIQSKAKKNNIIPFTPKRN